MRHLLVLLVCLSGLSLGAQDPHFSDYSNFPLQLNPALTGQVPEGSGRVQAGYRDQWSSVLGNGAFRTSYLSFDRRNCAPFQGDFWSFGGHVLGDQRGDFPLQRLDAFATAAYMKRLAEPGDLQMYMGVGLEGGVIHQRLGQNGRTFDEQFDDPTAPGEMLDQFNFTVLDYGFGFSFYLASRRNTNFSFSLGGAIKHLGEPNYEFFAETSGVEARLKRRHIVHGSLTYPVIGDKLGLSWKGVFMVQAPYHQLVNRLELVFSNQFRIGGGLRQVRGPQAYDIDALIISTSLVVHRLTIAFSYDANISSLSAASASFGALEISLGYAFGNGKCGKVYCPG